MGRVRRGAVASVVAVVALCCTPAGADPTPEPSGGFSVPSESEVSEAEEAAAAAAREVAAITAEVEEAEARLRALQRGVAEAVAADERARAALAGAEAEVRRAGAALAAASRARDAADRELSGQAALMYMQGGDLGNLTTLLLSPPHVMSDLAVVLEHEAGEVRSGLDAATSAAMEATAREQVVLGARNARTEAVDEARAAKVAAERRAAAAGAEAARLGARQEELTERLAELEQGAQDLLAQREAAAERGRFELLGLQAESGAPREAQEIARAMMPDYGWDAAEFGCLVSLWNAESGWSWSAANPSSGAYGIPQALPGWKMASAGSDWLTNPTTQITWGLGYIEDVYGSPCAAYDAFLGRSPHWY